MKKNNENTNAFLIHIVAFGGFMFPFGHIIAPLVAWQTLKYRSPFLDSQGKEAVNFNISYTLYIFVINAITRPFHFNSFFRNFNPFNNFNFHINITTNNMFTAGNLGIITSIIYIIGLVLIIIASLKARDGENYTYPFTIKFIK